MILVKTARKTGTRRKRVEDKERAIVDAAHRVFMEHGLEGARMSEIARRAAVAEGTLYLYFKNKSALVDAVINAFYERLTAEAAEGVAKRDSLQNQLEFLALHHLRSCLSEWRVLELAGGGFRSTSGRMAEEVLHLNRSYVAVFDQVFRTAVAQGLFRREVSLSGVRDLFYGGLEYVCRTHILRGHRPEAPEVADSARTFANLVLHGVAQPSAAEEKNEPNRLEHVATRLEAVAARLEGTE